MGTHYKTRNGKLEKIRIKMIKVTTNNKSYGEIKRTNKLKSTTES